MSLRRLLLVDDSRAIVTYETAVLHGLYAIESAASVREAWALLARAMPAAVLLDLSMPDEDGDVLLARMKADPALARVPVIVVSSEHARAASCLAQGAAAFVAKPIRAAELRAIVARVIADADRRAASGSAGVLFASIGEVELGFTLEAVRAVVMQPATRASELDGIACEAFDFHGERALVLDLAARIGAVHSEAIVDRKVVLLERSPSLFGVAVDSVRDPILCAADEIEPSAEADGGPLAGAIRFNVRRAGKATPVVDPIALFGRAS